MRTFHATEYGSVDIPASELLNDAGEVEIHSSLVGRDFFDIRLRKGSLRIFAGGFIGLIPLNERIAIDVQARAPIGNFMRVLRVAEYVPVELEEFARAYVEAEDSMPSMRDVYARALLKLLEPLVAFGLMRDYRREEAVTDAPRGRILMADRSTQLGLVGASPRVAASWFQRSVDVPANRCIKFVLWLLARSIGSDPSRKGARQTLRGLNAAYRLFDGVTLERRLPLSFLEDPLVAGRRALPSSRAYYRDALQLAAIIARDSSLALDRAGSDLRTVPLLVDMDVAFESYVRAVLRESEAFRGSGYRVFDGNRAEGMKLLFDEKPSGEAKPDVVIANRSSAPGRASIVADVKYKPAKGGRPDRADLNQVIAYAASYRSPKALVIQPRGPDSKLHGLRFLGRISELEVFQFVYDLGVERLAEEEQRFSEQVAALLVEDQAVEAAL